MQSLRLLGLTSLLISALPAGLFCQLSGGVPPDAVLARIGTKVVTAEELVERIELMPWKDKELVSQHDSLKARALRSLVAEKLLALEAERQGIGNDERTQAMLNAVERMLTKDQLYREEVVSKAAVKDTEIRRGLIRYPWSLVVKGYSFPDEKTADGFTQSCRNAPDLDSTVRALSFMALKVTDTLSISYSDLFPSYEEAIYALHGPGVTDPAFSPAEGWGVFRVFDRHANPLWSSQTQPEIRIEVQRKARTRSERDRALAYAQSYIRQRPMHIDSTLFIAVAESVVTLVHGDSSVMAHRLSNYVDLLRAKFDNQLHRVFARGNGNTWTLEDILESLRYYPGEFPRKRNPRVIVFAFNRMVLEAVEGEMFSAEGKKRGLERSAEVQRQMTVWREAWRAWEMGRSVVESAFGPTPESPRSDDTSSISEATRVTNLMNAHIASLAKKYGVEFFEKNLSAIPISRFSMVTKHFIGFGGVLLAMPMIVPEWGWIYRLSSPVVAP